MPSHINDFVMNTFDVDELELLLLDYHNRSEYGLAENYADFINGFTLATVFAYRDKFLSNDDQRWLRIRISMIFAPIIHKILN
jgi:hypothetical protein